MAGTGEMKKGKGGDAPGGDNYVVRAKDGKLFVASGETGNVREVKAEHKKEIESLIKQRQALGLKLSQLLEDRGYVVAPSFPTHVIAPGEDKPKKADD